MDSIGSYILSFDFLKDFGVTMVGSIFGAIIGVYYTKKYNRKRIRITSRLSNDFSELSIRIFNFNARKISLKEISISYGTKSYHSPLITVSFDPPLILEDEGLCVQTIKRSEIMQGAKDKEIKGMYGGLIWLDVNTSGKNYCRQILVSDAICPSKPGDGTELYCAAEVFIGLEQREKSPRLILLK